MTAASRSGGWCPALLLALLLNLLGAAQAFGTPGQVLSEQKISDTEGGFSGVLSDEDDFGYSATALGDLDGDGAGDLAVGAYYDDDGGSDRGAVWVLFLDTDGTVKAHQKISDTEGGFTGVLDNGDRFGTSAAALGDLDGDGVGDLAVGAYYDDDGGSDRGAVWVLFLDSDGTVKSHQKISDTEGGFTGVLDNYDYFGTSVAALGDLDGDGVGDLAVGVWVDDDGGSDRGAVWVLFLDSDGTVKSHQKISDTEGGFTGVLDNYDYFGTSVAALEDLDGDGVRDLAVGAGGGDDGGSGRGAVWVLFLDTDGTVKSHQKISDTEGGFTGVLDNSDHFGWSVAALGDLDGDGVRDLAVGAGGDDDGGSGRGAVWVLFLDTDGTVKSHQKISDAEGGFTAVLDNYDYFGRSVAALGDLDVHGVGDLAVGAANDDGGSGRGAVWVLSLDGVPPPLVLSEQKISDTEGAFTGVLGDVDYLGSSATALGDLDGDGVGDLAVGAYRDDDGGDGRGAVWVLFLDTDGTVKSHQKISDTEGGFTGVLDDGDRFGNSVAALGDLDGDGVGDLAVGTRWDGDGGIGRGAVWVLFLDTDGTVKSHQKISDTEGGFLGVLDDYDYFGWSVAALGDLDGDGVGDLAVGAHSDDDGGSARGAVWVLFLDSDGTVKSHQKISDIEGGFTGVLENADNFGSSVAALGDLDGDRMGDLAVGAGYDDDGGENHGAVWVLFLDTDGTVKAHQKISDTEGGFTGVLDDWGNFGSSAAALGDLDGDGVGDLAVGAKWDDDGGTSIGAVWVLFLDTDGTVKSHQKVSDTEGGFIGVLENGDSFGSSVAALGDLDGDGVGDLAVGAERDDDGGTDRGAVWVLSLNGEAIVCGNSVLDPIEECDDGGTAYGDGCSAVCEIEDRVELYGLAQGGRVEVTVDQVTVGVDTTPGQTSPQVIAALAAAINADATLASLGTTALAIGNALVTNGTVNAVTDTDPGLFWVSWAPPGSVLWEQKISDTEGGFTGVLSDADDFGYSATALGDLDGDGAGDLAVGAYYDDDGGSDRGAVWVLFLDTDGTVKAHQKISDTEGGFTGVLDNGDRFGTSAAALGDLDGDGVGDLAVGAYYDDDGGSDRGAVWVLFLDSDGTVKSHQKISDTEGGFTGVLNNSAAFGTSVAALGDLDGDGVGDLAVGAWVDDDGGSARGAVWVLFLDSDGTVKSHQKISDTEGGFTGVLDNYDFFGSSVAALEDLDGDGVGDLAVGADGDDDGGSDRGAVWVLFLDTDGTVKSHQKISDTEGGFTGVLDNSDHFGWSAAALGDLDGDGVGDLAVAAVYDDDGGSARGAVWVLFLDTDGTVKSHQKISDTEGGFTGVLDNSDFFGSSVAALGDLDGDGVGDLAVGADWDDDGGNRRGAVWVLALGGVPSAPPVGKTLDWYGTLDFEMYGTNVVLEGTGVATVNSPGGGIHLSTLRLAGGISGSGVITDPLGTETIVSVRIAARLGTGTLSGISGAPPLNPPAALPIPGLMRLCFFVSGCAGNMPLNLTVNDGNTGFGVGGLVTAGRFGLHRMSIEAAPWTLGTATGINQTASGGFTTVSRFGFVHGAASGADSSTAAPSGVIQLIAPQQVLTAGFLGNNTQMVFFSTLTLHFIPEPGLLLLIGSGAVGLGLLGRSRMKK